jgi:putative ABC transport system permease protein
MITLFHFFRLAIHNLRRGGQRVLVALLCITFGIMALVAMNMLAGSIASAVQVTPAELLGGDISMGRKVEDTIRSTDTDQLKALQQSGEISRYTLIAFSSSIMFRTPASGEIHFIGNGLGVEPDKYPLAGSLTIGEPGSTGLPTLLQQVGDVVITRDVAEEYKLKVGDALILTNLRVGVPVKSTVRAIAYDTPNHQGDKIYYSVETAQKLVNGQPVINTVMVNTDQAEMLTEKLDSSGWSVDWAAGRRDSQTGNMWVIGLRGAGILGLLVSGIGIANTMQVLLRRRQREIAIWKTIGYRESDLRLIFGLEAGLLGLTGSLLGAGLGVLISTGLLELFRRTSTLLYAWTFSPTPPLMGVLVGTLTTVIFASWAIVISSQARPMALLRNEPVDIPLLSGCQSIGLGLLLAVPFIALTSLVMQSVLAGIGVLVGIGFGIALLGGFFSAVLWVCTRFLPLRGFPLVHMAFNSLRRRGFALVFAMIALFIGVLSMSMGMAVAQISERKISSAPIEMQDYNLNILATAGQETAIRQAVQALNPQKVDVGYRTALEGLHVLGGAPLSGSSALTATELALVGRSIPQDYLISGADWGSQPDGVYAYKWANLKAGSQVQAAFRDGTTHTFTVVGSYDINLRSNNLYPPTGLLMTAEAFTRVARPDSLTYFVQVAPDQISRASAALGTALPQATVINLVAYASRFMHSYQNLFTLPIVMSALALLAGLLLVANSVSLAMLDRRYEIGILKTVGYSRRQILSIFAVEYGLVGLLATGTGVLFIQGLLVVLAIAQHLAAYILLLSIPALALIAFCGVGLTLLTVFGVTWEPTRVSPVVILNERN